MSFHESDQTDDPNNGRVGKDRDPKSALNANDHGRKTALGASNHAPKSALGGKDREPGSAADGDDREADTVAVANDREPNRLAEPVCDEAPPVLGFPVVGIGASAGGLEAMIEFLSGLRSDIGMAFVFVQHLPPDRETMLVEIFSRKTALPVVHVEDEMRIEPNYLYIIRPGRKLTIQGGQFHLGEQLARPMNNRPIDDFFRSLASEQRERGIAVVLSGMGSNGAAGAQAIKAVGGLCIAQDPETAQFPSMPRHLIDAGFADYILPPHEMPNILLAYADHPYARDGRSAVEIALQRESQQLSEVVAILRTRSRHDFTGYKRPTILRRIQRRMGLTRVTKIGDYARILRQSPTEIAALADDILIHVTGFFRDPEAWEVLRAQVIVPLVNARETGATIRAWVAACASGEEAYSLAILLAEEAEKAGKGFDIKIFATDTQDRTLQNARQGVYPGGIESEVSSDRLARFFQKEDAVYRVRPELRECVVFAPQNILRDPPFSRLDIVTCRNLLIYLEPDLQQRVIALLHFGLRPGGVLFLGTSETVGGQEDLFEPIDKKARIFRRVGPTRHGQVDFPISQLLSVTPSDSSILDDRTVVPKTSIAQLTLRALSEYHTPAAVTIDRDYRIVYYHGNTAPYLSQPPGEPTRDLLAVVRDTLRGVVRVGLQQSLSRNAPVTIHDGWIESPGGKRDEVAVTVSPLDKKMTTDHFVVSFRVTRTSSESEEPDQPGQTPESPGDLHEIRDELQSMIEELQTRNEELNAANEEVVSTNEELQSTNEELETSREEMQSLNEELSTVNAQLQAKVEEYQAVTSDLSSLLTSTDIAVLFLDTRFRIRRFTPQMRDLLEVIPTDIGRPLSDLARKFEDPGLLQEAAEVLERLTPMEREISVQGGRWFVRRLTPYRTSDNRIDGVVIAFLETTARHNAETALRKEEEQFRRSIEDAPVPVIVQAENGQVIQISNAWTTLTGYTVDDISSMEAWIGRVLSPAAHELRAQIKDLFKTAGRILDVEIRIRARDGSERDWQFTASSPGSLADGRRFFVGMAVDITQRKRAEADLKASRDALEAANAMKDRFLANISHELRTPLSVILMWSSLITRNELTEDEKKRGIDAIARSAESQRRLIEDLLDMTRITSGKLRVSLSPTDLNAVVLAAVDCVRPLALKKHQLIEVQMEDHSEPILADADRMEQVVWNLMTNAVKFTPEGGTIRIDLNNEDHEAVLCVRDSGKGIEPSFLGKLFEPFMQAEVPAVSAKTGLGLGLSITKSLVALHGGSIQAFSEGEGKGAEFVVRVPRLSGTKQVAGRVTHEADAVPLADTAVLLVEDNVEALRAIQVALESLGARVTAAESAMVALEAFEARSPDLIVSDLSMPEIDGLELMKQIRQLEAQRHLRHTPAIALTARATSQDRDSAFSFGFDAFVTKPATPEILASKALELLNR